MSAVCCLAAGGALHGAGILCSITAPAAVKDHITMDSQHLQCSAPDGRPEAKRWLKEGERGRPVATRSTGCSTGEGRGNNAPGFRLPMATALREGRKLEVVAAPSGASCSSKAPAGSRWYPSEEGSSSDSVTSAPGLLATGSACCCCCCCFRCLPLPSPSHGPRPPVVAPRSADAPRRRKVRPKNVAPAEPAAELGGKCGDSSALPWVASMLRAL